MKKLLVFVAAIPLFIFLLTSAAPIYADSTSNPHGDNELYVSNYQIDYYLGRNDADQSTLKTIETIQAVMPAANLNHGLERAIPTSYDGHGTDLRITSVTDAGGTSLPYTTYKSNDNLVVRIGKADTYVHGPKSYKITYQQRDVTRYFKDTDRDEFYWDTNGTDWSIPIDNLNVRLHLGAGLASQLTGNTACYQGATGSTDRCNLQRTNDGFAVSASGLTPYQNVTLAVGFKPATFAAYQPSPWERLLPYLILFKLITITVAVIWIIGLLIMFGRLSNRRREIGTIIPEYTPPKDYSVTVSASIINRRVAQFSAQLIDLAVRGYLKIYETRPKSPFRRAQYELEITQDPADLRAEEQEILKDMFDEAKIGARFNMQQLRRGLVSMNFTDNDSKVRSSINTTYGLRAADPARRSWFKRQARILLVLGLVTLSPEFLIAALVAFICGWLLKPLTDRGLELSRYLKGLEMYIKTAEVDRIRMLQSPEGAKQLGGPVDPNNTAQLIKLYEITLPYAILFGQEKEWNKRLADYYQTTNATPIWFAGSYGAFNAAAFSSALSSFNTATSASSGGSSGSGSSGGGGGGGGGGGW